MRAMWKGSISFGLVTIPIKLYAATETKNVQFRQVHQADGGRIQYKRVCTVDGEEVPYSDIAKGYELANGDMVVLSSDDLQQLPLSTSNTIDVLEFVPLEAVDPIYFDRGYYLEPDKASAKPYVLLRDALHKSGRVAIVKIALRQRETLALLRVDSDVLILQTMLWPDEVRPTEFAFLDEDPPQIRDEEMQMAGMLIDSLSEDVFEPDKYHDEYREAVLNLIEAKAEGQESVYEVPEETSGEVVDLMAALQASVEGAKGGSGGDKDGSSGKGRSGGSDGGSSRKRSSSSSAKSGSAKSGSAKSGTAKSDNESSAGGKSGSGSSKKTARKSA